MAFLMPLNVTVILDFPLEKKKAKTAKPSPSEERARPHRNRGMNMTAPSNAGISGCGPLALKGCPSEEGAASEGRFI